MHRRPILALGGATLALVLASPGAALAVTVAVRVEGKTHSLLAQTKVHTHNGWITKGGVPTGKCSAASGQGALDTATHHSWGGTFSSSLGSYFIKTILGETDNGPSIYWGIWVNNVSASTGACGIKLHKGDQLLFAAAPYPAYPLGLIAPSSAHLGRSFAVKVVGFNASGKSKPLAGAHVNGGVTNGQGIVHIVPTKKGTLDLGATDKGYIRDEVLVHVSS
jgi:hypothetical protein